MCWALGHREEWKWNVSTPICGMRGSLHSTGETAIDLKKKSHVTKYILHLIMRARRKGAAGVGWEPGLAAWWTHLGRLPEEVTFEMGSEGEAANER